MKSLKIYVSFMMMFGVNHMYSGQIEQIMAPYSNQIVKAGFSIGSDGMSAVILQFTEQPICFYAPSSYADSLDESIKSFILPRTNWIDRNLMNFMKELELLLEPLGIRFDCFQLSGKNFGLQIVFSMNSLQYEIKKVVKEDSKVVCFEIKLKK